ncbi:MAG: hypothetical protein FJ004_03895 [Chloroflexi bacterium]|nr:hypothetical protein [Chloroflexota bacterium]
MNRQASRKKLPAPESGLEELKGKIRNICTSDAVAGAVARILTKAPQLEEFVLDACRFTTHYLKGCMVREVVLHRGRESPDIKLYLIVVSDQLLTKREKLLEWNLAKQIATACLSVFAKGKSRSKLRSEAEELATDWGFTPVG